MTITYPVPRALRRPLLGWASRPLRFAGTGGTAGAAQLLVLVVLTHLGIESFLANGTAFLLAAQINFVLSSTVTWGDRAVSASLRRRWLLFHASISLMAAVNMGVFLVARGAMGAPLASLAGIAAGAAGNYLLGDWLVFRRAATPREP